MQSISTWVVVIAVIVGIVIKVYYDIMYKTARKIGKAKIMDIILLVNQMTENMTLDDLKELLIRFKKKELPELEMKVAVTDLESLLSIQNTLRKPAISKEIQEYKRKKEYGIIKNKKRWNQILKDMSVDKALDGILDMLMIRNEIQAQAANKKVPVDQVKALINVIKSDANIKKNRATRKKLEAYTEELRSQEKEVDLKRMQLKLYDIFKRK